MARAQIIPGSSSGSQLRVLRNQAAGAHIRHGDTARVRIRNVRTERMTEETSAVFFCASEVEVLEFLERGDGSPMPETDMAVENMGKVPEESYFSVEGIICSNGRNVFTRTRPSLVRRVADLIGV